MVKVLFRSDVPIGSYYAFLCDVVETTHEEYGPGLRWDFEIDRGRYRRTIVSRTTKLEPTNRNSCGKFLSAVSGLPAEEAAQHDTDDFLETLGMIVVEQSPGSKGVRVGAFVRDVAAEDDTSAPPATRQPGEDDAEAVGAVPAGNGGPAPWEKDEEGYADVAP